jgi:hypothetical protein
LPFVADPLALAPDFFFFFLEAEEAAGGRVRISTPVSVILRYPSDLPVADIQIAASLTGWSPRTVLSGDHQE